MASNSQSASDARVPSASSTSFTSSSPGSLPLLTGLWAVFAKEVRTELRTRELLVTTAVFALTIVFMFSFSFDPTSEESRRIGPGLLWIAFLFAGTLMLEPAFLREQSNDTLAALRLAPIAPTAILLGKMLANFLFLSITEALLVPVFAVFYNVSVASVLPGIILVCLLGTLGIVIPGTIFSAVTAHARMRELLLPLLLLPIFTPILIAATEATAALLSDPPEWPAMALRLLAGADIIFLTAAVFLFDSLLEE